MMGRMVNVIELMNANQPRVQQPCGYHGFVQTNPPIFTGGKDPMVADHWLRTIEQKFTLIQCTKEEKVSFAAHQLQEAAGSWWHDY